jgi:hypothetical protein
MLALRMQVTQFFQQDLVDQPTYCKTDLIQQERGLEKLESNEDLASKMIIMFSHNSLFQFLFHHINVPIPSNQQ